MGLLAERSTRSRGARGASLAVLCVVGAMVAPSTTTAQAPTTGAAPPAATGSTPPTDPGATGATPPAAGTTTPGATTPPADGTAVDPGAVTTNPATPGADPATPGADPAVPGATPTVPGTDPTQAPGTTTTETAPAGGVVVDEPDDSLPGWVWGAVAVGIVAAALVAWLLVLASGRFERLAPVGHALGEAGWRLSNRWAEFVDWLRFGGGR